MALPRASIRSNRWFIRVTVASLCALLTVAVTWLLAHEGHASLPTKGAQVDAAKGQLFLSRDALDALDVQTAPVESGPVAEKVLAYATLTAPWRQHAFATSRLAGRIVRMKVQPGEIVAADQVLAEVESADLESLQLELLNAANDVQLSSEILKTLEAAARNGTISDLQLLETQTRHKQYLNTLDVARSKWGSLGLPAADLAQLFLEKTPILRSLPLRSPVKGTVIHADLGVGKMVEPLEHLFEIVDLSTVWVEIGVLEKDLHRVAVGQAVELRLSAYPGEVFRTTVKVKGYYLDPQTHLNTVWAEVTNPSGTEPRLLPGMAGEAELLLAGPPAVTSVPVQAVFDNGVDRFVLVEEASAKTGSEYKKRNVGVGRRTAERVEVRSGDLYPGERVVTQGGPELAHFFPQNVLRVGAEAARNLGVKVEPATVGVVEDVLEMDGAVDVPADLRAVASAPFAGVLTRILVDRSQPVRKGDVLAEVVSVELQNLQLEFLRAHLEGQLLEENLKRAEAAKAVTPPRLLLEAKSQSKANQQQQTSLRRRLELAGLSAEQVQALAAEKRLVEALPVRSPIDGVLVTFDRTLGQALKADEPLFAVHDLSRPLIQGYVSERDVSRVRLGQYVRVRLPGEPAFLCKGTVIRSGGVFGTDSRTLAIWVELEKQPDAKLRHNQLARLTLTVGTPPPTLAVPRNGVVYEGTRAFVFVQKPDGVFERRSVETGRTDDRQVEIVRGLRAGEQVAVEGAAELDTAYALIE